MTGTISLREMRWWDLEAVVALERELFPEDAWSAGMFWSELARARGPRRTRHYVLAEHGDALAGYAGLAASGSGGQGGQGGHVTGDVQTIAVAPAEQGRGLGARLLTELLRAATGFGCREVFLEVRADNERAQRLYKRFGFEAVGIRRGYYQPGNHDALTMRRDHAEEDAKKAVKEAVREAAQGRGEGEGDADR
ncbi:ribosomal protein S18-alanine N-acetyltransferase [Streptomyces sp. 6N223]|uniref:ribosomal protein S18-alanine N-acetyltransferase n=1 Tax=Streptomyces sp. 6N223 TaxID=3457412 RepID=UPI003FD38676